MRGALEAMGLKNGGLTGSTGLEWKGFSPLRKELPFQVFTTVPNSRIKNSWKSWFILTCRKINNQAQNMEQQNN
jgi:hypothetical protein